MRSLLNLREKLRERIASSLLLIATSKCAMAVFGRPRSERAAVRARLMVHRPRVNFA
jgi:hypothetical protein